MVKPTNSRPNYSYCASYCCGAILSCPHYEKANPMFKVCKTYKLLQTVTGSPERLSTSRLEKMVELARKTK